MTVHFCERSFLFTSPTYFLKNSYSDTKKRYFKSYDYRAYMYKLSCASACMVI